MTIDSFERKVACFIDKEHMLSDGEHVVIALSGGADSVCLANILARIADDKNLSFTAVHIHHGIRGDEADRDEMFARSVATCLGMKYVCERCEALAYANKNHLTLEESARILRYEALERVADECGATRIAVAHHLDDQAETVLMNLLRGSGPDGLSGMSPIRGRYIRPLLGVTKSDILEYLSRIGQDYVIDSSNESKEHTRNRVRLELLPLARELYPQADRHIAALADDMNHWKSEITQSVEKCKDSVIQDGKIIISKYLKENHATRHELIRYMIEKVIPGTKDVTRVHYLQIDALALGDRQGEKTVHLPEGVVVRKQYDYLVVEKVSPSEEKIYANLQIDGSTMIACGDKNIKFSTKFVDEVDFDNIFQEKDYTKYIKYDRIVDSLIVRNPMEGDYFEIDGDGARKKLSRYYIDNKVPKSERDKKLVVADGSHIVWALPDRLSYAYRVDEDTERILAISLERY